MDRQTWFERYQINLGFNLERALYKPQEYIEEWKIVRITLFKLAVALLPKTERAIIRLIYFQNLTEEQVAKKLNISRLKVHRKKWQAMELLSESPLIKFIFPQNQIN